MTWTQIYSPVHGSLLASAFVAAIPVVVLLGLLAFFHVRAHWAALLGPQQHGTGRRRCKTPISGRAMRYASTMRPVTVLQSGRARG